MIYRNQRDYLHVFPRPLLFNNQTKQCHPFFDSIFSFSQSERRTCSLPPLPDATLPDEDPLRSTPDLLRSTPDLLRSTPDLVPTSPAAANQANPLPTPPASEVLTDLRDLDRDLQRLNRRDEHRRNKLNALYENTPDVLESCSFEPNAASFKDPVDSSSEEEESSSEDSLRAR